MSPESKDLLDKIGSYHLRERGQVSMKSSILTTPDSLARQTTEGSLSGNRKTKLASSFEKFCLLQVTMKGKGTIRTYFLTGKDGFDKPLPDLSKALPESEHEFK